MSLKQLKQATGDLTPASFRRPRCPLHSRDKDIYRDLVLRSTRTSEPSNSPFFTKLPAELRRMILVLAFGNGTIRLEINTESEKGQPIVQFPTDLPLGSCKCAPVNHVGNENPWIYDQSDPSRSYYDQSISRRRKWPFYVWRSFYRRMDDEGEHEDEEISRQRWLSYEWQNHKPKFVDSFLGWISSCRQAYAEGVEVLYRTNTFDMLGYTAMLLPWLRATSPDLLAMVTSLEVPWFVRGSEIDSGHLFNVRARRLALQHFYDYPQLLGEYVKEYYPNVRRLVLALGRYKYGSVTRDVDLEKDILPRVDSLVRCLMLLPSLMPPLESKRCQLTLVVPSEEFFSLFHPLFGQRFHSWRQDLSLPLDYDKKADRRVGFINDAGGFPGEVWRIIPHDDADTNGGTGLSNRKSTQTEQPMSLHPNKFKRHHIITTPRTSDHHERPKPGSQNPTTGHDSMNYRPGYWIVPSYYNKYEKYPFKGYPFKY